VSTALDTLAFLCGLVLVLGTLLTATRATILPRGVQNRTSRIVIDAVRAAFRLRTRRVTSYDRRDRVMSMLAPIALLTLLATWMLMIIAGYTLMYLGISGRSFERSLELSGSSVFTLGTSTDSHLWPSLLSYTEAGLGLLLLALLITFLPSIYGAFSRRENGVALLQVRAGNPPQAATMLIRFHRIEAVQYRLTELWRVWEGWFADIEETHSTFPILVFFRSPQPDRSWITAAGALLDGASFWAAAIEHPKDPDVQLCIRAGSLALRRIANLYKVTYDPDPAPDDPISVDRSEWDSAMAEMELAGLPLAPDRDQAWIAWKGWRVNYDTVLLKLARLIEAPVAPWVSDRSPLEVNASSQRRLIPRRAGGRPGG
jgi:hypothetical protein